MKMKTMFSRLFALVLITSLFVPNLVISVAATNEVELTKVTVVDESSDGRTFDVTYTINVDPTYVEPSDIVIVLDRSNSMLNEIGDTNNYVVYDVKAATIEFINQVMAVPGNRVAIVGYGTDSSVYNNYNYYTSASSAITAVNHLLATRSVTNNSSDYDYKRYGYSIRWTNFAYSQGGTNIQEGLDKAQSIVESSQSSTNKAVVLFTDGEANRGSYQTDQWGIIGYSWYGPKYGWITVYNEEAAIMQAEDIKDIPNTTIYSMGYFGGLSNPSTAIDTLNQIDSTGTCNNAPTTDELGVIFSNINSVINNIGTNAVVIDTLNTGFEIVPGSIVSSIGTATSSNNNQTLNWNIGSIGKGTYTLNMKIKVLDTAFVGGETNVLTSTSSQLTYTDINGASQTVSFPDNYVDIPPLGKFKDLAVTTRTGQPLQYVNSAEDQILARVTFTTLRDFKLLKLKLEDTYPDQDYSFVLNAVKNVDGALVEGFDKDADEIIYSGVRLPIGTYTADITITSPSNFLTAVGEDEKIVKYYDMEVVQVITQEVTHLNSTTYPATSSTLRIQYNGGPVIQLTPNTLKFVSSVDVSVNITGEADIIEYKCLRGQLEVSDFLTTDNGYGLHDVNSGDPRAITAQFTVQAIGDFNGVNGIFAKNDYYTVYAKDATGKESVKVIRINNLLIDNPDLL